MPESCNLYRRALPPKGDAVERGALIGNFDGLHLGHQALIEYLLAWKRLKENRELVLISFYPHPLTVLRHITVPRLASLRQKRAVLSSLGIKQLLLMQFTKRLAEVEAEDFVDKILVEKLQIDTLFVGPDAAVGKQRKGDVEFLKRGFSRHNKTVEVVPFIEQQGKKIGSAMVRDCLAVGKVAGVHELLGRPFAIEGRVLDGDKRGRSIGVPTANITPGNYQMPKPGVYATVVMLDGIPYSAVTNVGTRPTFEGSGTLIESHLLSYSGDDFYGTRIEVGFYSRIRDEKAFSGLEELKKAICRDIAFARSYFKNLGK